MSQRAEKISVATVSTYMQSSGKLKRRLQKEPTDCEQFFVNGPPRYQECPLGGTDHNTGAGGWLAQLEATKATPLLLYRLLWHKQTPCLTFAQTPWTFTWTLKKCLMLHGMRTLVSLLSETELDLLCACGGKKWESWSSPSAAAAAALKLSSRSQTTDLTPPLSSPPLPPAPSHPPTTGKPESYVDYFSLNQTSAELVLLKPVDRELHSRFDLVIKVKWGTWGGWWRDCSKSIKLNLWSRPSRVNIFPLVC